MLVGFSFYVFMDRAAGETRVKKEEGHLQMRLNCSTAEVPRLCHVRSSDSSSKSSLFRTPVSSSVRQCSSNAFCCDSNGFTVMTSLKMSTNHCGFRTTRSSNGRVSSKWTPAVTSSSTWSSFSSAMPHPKAICCTAGSFSLLQPFCTVALRIFSNFIHFTGIFSRGSLEAVSRFSLEGEQPLGLLLGSLNKCCEQHRNIWPGVICKACLTNCQKYPWLNLLWIHRWMVCQHG